MPATWTTPRTWAVGELVTAALMNTHLRDNLDFLKAPPLAQYVLNEASDFSTSSTSFVDVDAAGNQWTHTIVTAGGAVLAGAHFSLFLTSGQRAYFDIEVDGVRHAGDDGIIGYTSTTSGITALAFTRVIAGLTAGSHTFRLQWKLTAGAATLYAGAGTANFDLHPQFWVREI